MEGSRPRSARWHSERGEITSWLILGAALCLIASGLVVPLRTVLEGLASNVGTPGGVSVVSAAGGGGTGSGDTGSGDTGSGDTGSGDTGGTDSGGSSDGVVLTPAERDEINSLIASLPEDPRETPYFTRLREGIDEVVDDPALADAIFGYAQQGYPIEIAIALATGDWSGVEGGNPADYGDDQIATVLRALGYDVSDNLTGVDDLLATLDPGLLALLFHDGREYELSLTAGAIGTPGTLILPVGGSASIEASVTVALGDPAIGVGFSQTQSLDITARVIGRVEGAAGKSTLAKVYKWINRLGYVPENLQALVNRNPLLRGALKGLPFSVAYSQYAGTELAYEATLTTEQAAAVDAGDLSALPDIYDPSSLEPGNSVLIRGGEIEGSDFMLKYKALQLDENRETFDGVGFGVTVLDDGRVAIYAGDIEAVEHSVGIGLPFAQIGRTARESEYGFDYAVLDLNTPEGQAAYDAFITGGGVPNVDTTGVTTATSVVHTGDYDVGVHVDIGPIQVREIFNSTEYTTETLTYTDGTQVTTFDAGYNGDSATQVVVPHNTSGQLDFDQAEITIVLGDLSDGDTHAIGMGFDGNTNDPGDLPSGRHDVQLTFTPAELIELQQIAQQAVRNTAYDGNGDLTQDAYDQALADPSGFVEQIAAAGSVQELIEVIIRDPVLIQDSPVIGLRDIAIEAALGGPDFDTNLPGSIETRPAS